MFDLDSVMPDASNQRRHHPARPWTSNIPLSVGTDKSTVTEISLRGCPYTVKRRPLGRSMSVNESAVLGCESIRQNWDLIGARDDSHTS
jgi:hypothetical protein